MIIDACKKVKSAPKADRWSFEITPIDFFTKTMVAFSENAAHYGQVYNVVRNNPVPAHIVFDLMMDAGLITDFVSIDEWKSRLLKKAEDENIRILNVLAQSLDDFELYLNGSPRCDCSGFERALATHDLQRPAIGSEYFMKLLRPAD